jgi:hypothetical protein
VEGEEKAVDVREGDVVEEEAPVDGDVEAEEDAEDGKLEAEVRYSFNKAALRFLRLRTRLEEGKADDVGKSLCRDVSTFATNVRSVSGQEARILQV